MKAGLHLTKWPTRIPEIRRRSYFPNNPEIYQLMSFTGVYTALATPFSDGTFDRDSFVRLIEHQIAGGVDGIVPVGTTGESPTLSHQEHCEVVELAVKTANGRCKVMAGTGSNCTDEAVSLTKEAEKAGADGALLVAPYYNKPTQEGLFLHYRAVADAVGIPLVLYSIPGRCGIEIGVETTLRLSESCPNIRCIKEAGGTVERVSALRRALPSDFLILSGDDSLTLPFLSVGASGVISVASNLLPAEIVALVSAWMEGRPSEAREIHLRLYQVFKDLFIESNPVPVKHALARAGIIRSAEVRLPLAPFSSGGVATLEKTLAALEAGK